MAGVLTAIVGPGAVGRALGRLLRRRGYRIAAVAGRSRRSTREGAAFIGGGARVCWKAARAVRGAELVLLTVPDRAIESVCEAIASGGMLRRGAVVLHCSGAYGPEALAAARGCGAHVGALHPVQSFASADEAVKRLRGAWFTFSGDGAAEARAREVVDALDGRMATVAPADRSLYHAGLCVISNYLVALSDLGKMLLERSGMDAGESAKAARGLVAGTVANIAAVGVPDALTGPVARGDVGTVKRHLDALAGLGEDVCGVYCALGLYTVGVARRKGTLRAGEARELARVFRECRRREGG